MRNCTLPVDGVRICYVAADDDDDGWPATIARLRRDAALVALAVALTFVAVAVHNFYLRMQLRRREAEDERAGNRDAVDDVDDPDRDASRPLPAELLALSSRSVAASLARIHGDEASGKFLSAVFRQVWDYANVAVSNSIKEALEPTLKEMKVPLHFVKLDLGDVPVETTNMFIHRVDLAGGGAGRAVAGERAKQAGIQIDVDVDWNGNCDIMLQATMSRSAKVTFGVRAIKLSGRMHILLSPLTTEIPCISAVQYGFTNPPDIDLEFSGAVKTLTSLGFVQKTLVGVIQSSLASMLVLPQRMVMPMDLGSYDYLDTYQPPVGMVRLTAVRGRGFKVLQKMFLKDIPDVYCKFWLGASDEPFRTSTQTDNLNPSWKDERRDYVLYDMDQKIYLEAYDEDKGPLDPDDFLGRAEISARNLFQRDGTAELELELDGNGTGCHITVSAELFHLSEHLGSLTSPEYEGKDQLCGLATVIVTRAFDVPLPRESAATYVKVTYGEGSNHERTFYTGVVADYPGLDALNPMYDCLFYVPLSRAMLRGREDRPSNSKTLRKSFVSDGLKSMRISRRTAGGNDVTFALVDGDGAVDGSGGRGELGRTTVTHDDLLEAYRHIVTETRHVGDGGAKLEFRVILSGMQSETEKLRWAAGEAKRLSSQDSDPIYVPQSLYGGISEGKINVRVTVVRGRGFRIRKRRIGKKDDVPDMYCRVCLNHGGNDSRRRFSLSNQTTPWQTATIKDDTIPNWNESREFAGVDPLVDFLRVDAYDENSHGRDERHGSVEFSLERLLRKRILEKELMEGDGSSDGSTPTNSYVTLQCVRLAAEDVGPANGDDRGDNKKAVCFVAKKDRVDDRGDDDANIGRVRKKVQFQDDDGEEEDGNVVAPLMSISASPSSHKKNEVDDLSVSSTSSANSISRKMSKAGKSFPKRLGKMSFRKKSSRKKGKDRNDT